jgi:epoxyqueuosine reductase
MTYMERHVEKRIDPTKLIDNARSVISVIMNYFPGVNQGDPEAPVLSKYAYGEDYHNVLRKRLKHLLRYIQEAISPAGGRAFVDSAPVLDRVWARKAGLGWIGKNSNLISPEIGSFFFIGSLIVDITLHYDTSINDLCGNCSRCIEACPTQAIIEPHTIDARRCISFLTIENRSAISPEFHNKFVNRVFGCDICQDVCPWNKQSDPHRVDELNPPEGLLEMTRKEWYNLNEKGYNDLFSKSAVKRAKFEGLRRNLEFIKYP